MQKERKFPVIAIVGTPNVGKSTLINRICPGVRLVVDKIPGSPRDRKYISAEWGGINFDIVDTGGLDLKSKDLIAKQVFKQAKIAVDESTIILFVVDADVGITTLDKLNLINVFRFVVWFRRHFKFPLSLSLSHQGRG
ncbi:unnamed protein product [marine sediment metagenome]|uniref:G domain-containing protein n=1 Tax=marine sediment metagenome TaxID=412755 RepID=X1CPB5_9ZZZZ